MKKQSVIKRLGMEDEFSSWMKQKKNMFTIGQKVRVKFNTRADIMYKFSKGGSIGTIESFLEGDKINIRWEKLTGGRPSRTFPVYDVKKEFLEFI